MVRRRKSVARVIATALSIVLAAAIASCSGGSGGPHGDCFPMTPICGEPCPCDCKPCFEAEPFCARGGVYQCAGSCHELVETCSDPDACVAGHCANSVEDCELVRTTYEAHLSPSRGGSIVAVIRAGSTTLEPGVYGPVPAARLSAAYGRLPMPSDHDADRLRASPGDRSEPAVERLHRRVVTVRSATPA
jgi:hypothetical protein